MAIKIAKSAHIQMTPEEFANLEKQETIEAFGQGHFELEKVLKEIEN